LHADQGYGDAIQYCRYAPLLQARGARVIVEAPSALRSLMDSLKGVDEWTTRGDPAPPFDFQCPFSNLPGAFRSDLTSIPGRVPYLGVDKKVQNRWAKRLGRHRTFRVGLSWSGSPGHLNDRHRSVPLAELMRLKDTGAEFVSLQKELRESDPSLISTLCRWNFAPELSDFSDTAAVISQLDLVISVDTAVAHLAGALGKPVWILLPYVPDWRWMLDRNDSPWYPTARLYRQATLGRWEGAVTTVHQGLAALVTAERGRHRS
jgi:hypothetical protein